MTIPTNTPSEQPAVPEGMVAWAGGDSAPNDWDQKGRLLCRDGHTFVPGPKVRWTNEASPFDIIAYTPKPAIPASAGGAEAQFREPSWQRSIAFYDAAMECERASKEAVFADDVSEDQRTGFRTACGLIGMSLRVMEKDAAPAFNALPVEQPAQASEVERFRRLVERASQIVPLTFQHWHAAARTALNPSQERAGPVQKSPAGGNPPLALGSVINCSNSGLTDQAHEAVAAIEATGLLAGDEACEAARAILSALSSDRRVEDMRERCARIADLAGYRCEITIRDDNGWPTTTEGSARHTSDYIASAIRSLPVEGEQL